MSDQVITVRCGNFFGLVGDAAEFAPAAVIDIEQRRDQVDAGHAFGGRAVEDVANIAEQDDASILIVIGVREGDGRFQGFL